VSQITGDRSGWPIVAFKFPESYSNEEFDEYLGDLSVVVALRPTALIIDTSSAALPTAMQRHRLLRFAKADWQLLSNLRAIVFIVDSVVARCALTAISWLVAKPCPVALVANMREAQAFALATCAQRHRLEPQLYRAAL
jgi:hypothetical protein